MREDFFKVIVERERIHSGNKTAKRRERRKFNDPRGFEDAASFDGAGRTRKYGRNWDESEAKMLNENLGPMRRALLKFVGRKWDDVYSEFRENLNVKSATHKHVVDHLKQYVETSIVMSDDKPSRPMYVSRWGRGGYEYYVSSNRSPSFYVNPLTGILCKAPLPLPRKRDKLGPANFIKKAHDGTFFFYHRHKGMWFSFQMARLPAGRHWGDGLNGCTLRDSYLTWKARSERRDKGLDGLLGYTVGMIAHTRRWDITYLYSGLPMGTDYYCTGKQRQLSKKDLEELGLKNAKHGDE